MSMLAPAAQLLLGILLLAYASDWLTEGCARAARRFGISRFVVGALVIGFGTSSPELFTSVYASLRGSGGIAVGNAVGSNVTNLALILGSAVVLFPASIGRVELRNGGVCLGITLLAWWSMLGGEVARWEGVLLVLVFLAYLWYSVRNHEGVERREERGRILLPTTAGLAGVLLGSMLLVDSAAELARAFGVPESVIGLTLVAFGTSLPELAVSLVAARKGYSSMLIGNVLGSNIFNLTLVLGTAALVGALPVDEAGMRGMLIAILATAAVLLPMGLRRRLGRGEGALLLCGYLLFLWLAYS